MDPRFTEYFALRSRFWNAAFMVAALVPIMVAITVAGDHAPHAPPLLGGVAVALFACCW